jgi:hypothetical protein
MSILPSRTTAMRVASLITAINVLTAVGFSVAGLINLRSMLAASDVPTDASFIFALYAAARTIPLAATTLVAIYKRSELALQVLGRWRESYKCWTLVSACTSMILGNPSDRLLLPCSSFWRSTS